MLFRVPTGRPGILASLDQRAESYATRLTPPQNRSNNTRRSSRGSVDEHKAPVADPGLQPQRSRWLRELRTQNKRNVINSVAIISHKVVFWPLRNRFAHQMKDVN